MKWELSVVAPCFNEEKNVTELVLRLKNVFAKKQIKGQIVLVNDGSSDTTGEVIEAFSKDNENIKAVHHRTNLGIESAWRSGINRAGGTLVCLIDADMQNLPEDVWRLYREITTTNVDMVQGYRSSIGRVKDSRYLLSRGLIVLTNAMFKTGLTDPKSGFVIAAKATLENTLRHRLKYKYFQTFIAVSAIAKGYSVKEVETIFESRLAGKSFMSDFPLMVIFWVFVDLFKAWFEFRLNVKKDNIVAEFLDANPPSRRDLPLAGWRKIWFDIYFSTTPLHKWLITHRAKLYYEELKQSQWLSGAKLQELQEKKMRLLLEHAYHHVGYWRQTIDENGLGFDDIQKLDDLPKLPLLSKKLVSENLYFDMLSDNHDKSKILQVSTSGSTGQPFICFADQHQLEIRWAATQRSMEWTGYRFGDRCARLWHQTLGMSWLQIIQETMDAWFCRRIFIPAFEMSDANIAKFIKKLRAYKPVLIDGYAESFNFLAIYMKSHQLTGLSPKGIISSAQLLPETSRQIIESTFKCGVFDKYGSREFSGIAYECEAHAGHHIVAESYIVEILNSSGLPAEPGQLGEVVVTDLNNYCMPLIRYRVGDLAVAVDNTETCPCGRGLPRIGRIEGRTQAIVFGTNGTYMPGTFFSHLFKDFGHIMRQYQIVQESPGAMTFRIIKAPRFEEQSMDDLLEQLHHYCGKDMRIEVEFVESIALGRTGKHQAVISKIPIDFQNLPGQILAKYEEPLNQNSSISESPLRETTSINDDET